MLLLNYILSNNATSFEEGDTLKPLCAVPVSAPLQSLQLLDKSKWQEARKMLAIWNICQLWIPQIFMACKCKYPLIHPLILFETVMCCNLLGISKDQRKMDKGSPYLKESFYLLSSTIAKSGVWSSLLQSSFMKNWQPQTDLKKKLSSISLSLQENPSYTLEHLASKALEERKLAEQMDWPLPAQLP